MEDGAFGEKLRPEDARVLDFAEFDRVLMAVGKYPSLTTGKNRTGDLFYRTYFRS